MNDQPDPNLDTSWMADAECRGADPELFFPTRGEDTRAAKAMCADCPVRVPCLEYALANHERFGIWGGKSERERRQIRKVRGIVRRPPVVACGTTSGHSRHVREGTPPCQACREARARYAAAAKARMRERKGAA